MPILYASSLFSSTENFMLIVCRMYYNKFMHRNDPRMGLGDKRFEFWRWTGEILLVYLSVYFLYLLLQIIGLV
tara:strand:+ start:458 stop:676 length:219 start_codon:yes stop_codon:yes gene_type:complete